MTIESEGILGLYIVLLNNYFDAVGSIKTRYRNFVIKSFIDLKVGNRCNETRSEIYRCNESRVRNQTTGFIGNRALKQRIVSIGSKNLEQKVYS